MTDNPIAHWNTRYSTDGFLFGDAPNAFLAAQAHRLPASGAALSIADGEGRNGVWLAQQGLDVLSLDASKVAQAKARRLAEARGVNLRLELGDLREWVFPAAAFDVVAGIFFQFAGPPVRGRLFAGMRDALRPGGMLLLQGYRPEQLTYRTGGPSQAENLYTEDLLRAEFDEMEILELAAYDAVIEEGSAHKGMSALIHLVARKPG